MMNVPAEMEDSYARSDEFLKWLYEKTLNEEFEFYGFDGAWEESFGKDAQKLFYSLKQRQFLLYEKRNSGGGFDGYGRSTRETAVGLNKKAIKYLKALEADQQVVPTQPEPPHVTEVEPEKEPELEKDVAWFIYHTTGNMRTAWNYLVDARIYLSKETLTDRKQAEQEIRERGERGLEIVTKETLGK